MNEFSSSESVLKETNVKLTVLWLASMPLVLGAIFIAFAPTTRMALTTLAGYFLLSGGVHVVQTALATRRWRQRSLDRNDEKITYRSPGRVRSADWGDISRVKVRRNARGDVYSITLSGKKMRWFWIYGFNEMEKILSLVKDRVSDAADIGTSRLIFYLENPINFIVFVWVVTGITLFFLRWLIFMDANSSDLYEHPWGCLVEQIEHSHAFVRKAGDSDEWILAESNCVYGFGFCSSGFGLCFLARRYGR